MKSMLRICFKIRTVQASLPRPLLTFFLHSSSLSWQCCEKTSFSGSHLTHTIYLFIYCIKKYWSAKYIPAPRVERLTHAFWLVFLLSSGTSSNPFLTRHPFVKCMNKGPDTWAIEQIKAYESHTLRQDCCCVDESHIQLRASVPSSSLYTQKAGDATPSFSLPA